MLERPRERCLFLPHRGYDVAACVAETFWVLAGRNDVEWLSEYLPRAADFSDDGKTWRAGYGPRLRNWNGVDQLQASRRLLLEERLTRRAAMVLYDPDRDYVESKDIPCNNWLHWLVRGDHLHLNLAIRSNDIIWGFSGVNSFLWSVLHEAMAFWINEQVGEATYFASSLHLYDRHYARAEKCVAASCGLTCYDFGVPSSPFQTPWERFEDRLREWFEVERQVRETPNRPIPRSSVSDDPLLASTIRLLRVHHGSRQGWSQSRVRDELAILPEDDLAAAAYEQLARDHPGLLDDIPQTRISAFFDTYTQSRTNVPSAHQISALIKSLHRRKDKAYGDSWKRRGELTSVLANIARKVDRLERYLLHGTSLAEETILDTAMDLYVYTIKYRLFLFDAAPGAALVWLPPDAPTPFSDHASNFDTLVDSAQPEEGVPESIEELVPSVCSLFARVHAIASEPASAPARRLQVANELSALALRLVRRIATDHPATLGASKALELDVSQGQDSGSADGRLQTADR